MTCELDFIFLTKFYRKSVLLCFLKNAYVKKKHTLDEHTRRLKPFSFHKTKILNTTLNAENAPNTCKNKFTVWVLRLRARALANATRARKARHCPRETRL